MAWLYQRNGIYYVGWRDAQGKTHGRSFGTGNRRAAEAALRKFKRELAADTVEAVVSNRPCRPPAGLDKALEVLSENSGALYDPRVVDACLKLFSEKEFEFK